ncbi:hypothetical protein M0R45_014702 [Rubus argutus]|uniref:MHC class I antigen n=1 Tax=Rubus argutus TaxID=59490 RepID=A0AAW1XNE4_RUBAR
MSWLGSGNGVDGEEIPATGLWRRRERHGLAREIQAEELGLVAESGDGFSDGDAASLGFCREHGVGWVELRADCSWAGLGQRRRIGAGHGDAIYFNSEQRRLGRGWAETWWLGFKAHGEREEAAAAGLWQIETVNGDGLLKLD